MVSLTYIYSHHPHTNDTSLDIDVKDFSEVRKEFTNIFMKIMNFIIQFLSGILPVGIRIGILRLVPWSIPEEVVPLSREVIIFSLKSIFVFFTFHILLWYFVEGWVWLAFIYMQITGIYFLFFSQLSHLPSLEENKAHGNWSEKQVRSTENYEGSSYLWHFLSFGLSNQIEHHLLPSISESYLPQMCGPIREACIKYSVPYRDNSIGVATRRLFHAISKLLNRFHSSEHSM